MADDAATFDAEGVCSACRFAEYKATVDWPQREQELKALCNKFRRGNGVFDVIVLLPVSPRPFLKELSRLLKARGKMLLSTPNAVRLTVRLKHRDSRKPFS